MDFSLKVNLFGTNDDRKSPSEQKEKAEKSLGVHVTAFRARSGD